MTVSATACYAEGMGGAGGGIGGWPAADRPRERLYHKGADSLADAELLAEIEADRRK